jgi:hypothetical protein
MNLWVPWQQNFFSNWINIDCSAERYTLELLSQSFRQLIVQLVSLHTHGTSILLTDWSQLSVAVPPRWTVEPTDANVASGQDVTLHCQADGYPVPSITWRKAVGTLSQVTSRTGAICYFQWAVSFQGKCLEALGAPSYTDGWVSGSFVSANQMSVQKH